MGMKSKQIIKLSKDDERKIDFSTDGSLALQLEDELEIYETPEIKIEKLEELKEKIVMGCWQSSYSSNDGDGC